LSLGEGMKMQVFNIRMVNSEAKRYCGCVCLNGISKIVFNVLKVNGKVKLAEECTLGGFQGNYHSYSLIDGDGKEIKIRMNLMAPATFFIYEHFTNLITQNDKKRIAELEAELEMIKSHLQHALDYDNL